MFLIESLLRGCRHCGSCDLCAAIYDLLRKLEFLSCRVVQLEIDGHFVSGGGDQGHIIELIEHKLLGGGVVCLDMGRDGGGYRPCPVDIRCAPGVGFGRDLLADIKGGVGRPESVVRNCCEGHGLNKGVRADILPRDDPRPRCCEIVSFDRLRGNCERVGTALVAVGVLADAPLLGGGVDGDNLRKVGRNS